MAATALANARQLASDLRDVDQFLVRQEVEHFEAMSGFETENSYVVLGAAAQRAKFRMLAIEQSGVLARLVCGSRRPFTMKLVAAPLEAHGASARAGLGADELRHAAWRPSVSTLRGALSASGRHGCGQCSRVASGGGGSRERGET